jgi:hypothetical protein
MPPEPHHLLTGRALRDLKRAAVSRAPDGLHHVPEVEPPLAEVHVGAANDDVEDCGPRRHRAPDRQRPGVCPRERNSTR